MEDDKGMGITMTGDHPTPASRATAHGVGRGWNDQTMREGQQQGGQQGGDNDNNEGWGDNKQGERR
jgi:hypothetical protein